MIVDNEPPAYWASRATAERAMAVKARTPVAAAAHTVMAEAYELRAGATQQFSATARKR